MASPDTSSASRNGRFAKPVSGRYILLLLAIVTLVMLVATYFIARAVLPEAKEYHQKRPSLPPPAL